MNGSPMAVSMSSFTDLVKSVRKHKNGAIPQLDPADEEDAGLEMMTPKSFEEQFLEAQTEIRQLKTDISQQSKTNFKLENDLRFFDSKIALLINHKISLEEIESRVFDSDPSSTHQGLSGAFKDMECYGRLFFLLQTTPEYIAHLTRMVSSHEIDGLLQTVMFTLYGKQYEDREEHLLLSMFDHALTYEVQEATEINSLMRANTAITRMMTTYCRRGPGQEYIKTCLGDVVQELIATNDSLEIDPLKIYQDMIDNDQVQRPKEANKLLQEAEAHPKVQQKIREHAPVLQSFVLKILQKLKQRMAEVPFGIRWLCKATRALVQEKFPEAETDRINSFIGGFFFLRYINPIIATPHSHRLVLNPPPQQARRNLTLVAKLIQKLANTSSVRESYMMPVEPFVKAHNEELKSFLSELCEVPDFHEALQLEEYIALCRKNVYIEISPREMSLTHSLLLKYQGDIVTSPDDDPLTEVLKELPPPKKELEQSQIRLELIQLSRDVLDLPLFAPRGVSLDVSDELATARRQCRHLLLRLFSMAPHCLQEDDLQEALRKALASPLKDVVSDAELTSEHVRRLETLGGLNHLGKDLYADIKSSFPDHRVLLQKARLELKSLRNVQETMLVHTDYLQDQLDAYKEYLSAVRAKVGELQQATNRLMFSKPRGTYRFTHSQLEKEGVILETPGIPMQRRGGIFYMMSCSEPGVYAISMHYKGHQKPVYEKTINLEELLEMQHLRDPVIDMEGYVVLNVRRTLLLLHRFFMKSKESTRPISRHFSAPAISFARSNT